jgi:hypothetical protein
MLLTSATVPVSIVSRKLHVSNHIRESSAGAEATGTVDLMGLMIRQSFALCAKKRSLQRFSLAIAMTLAMAGKLPMQSDIPSGDLEGVAGCQI